MEKEIDSCIREIGGGRGEWWELMIHYICAEGHEDEFVNRIRNDLMDKMTKFEAKRAMERYLFLNLLKFLCLLLLMFIGLLFQGESNERHRISVT